MLLEIRLNHHAPFVDKFVLTECPWTYSGTEKPLYYDRVKNEEPFIKFKDKIIHNIYDVAPNGKINWDYEHDQRNSLRDITFYDDDLIIYSDCDELIRGKSVILEALGNVEIYPIITLDMELNWYYFNCVIKPGSKFQNDYSMESCFNHRWRMAKITTPKVFKYFENLYKIRELNLWDLSSDYTINKAGWHFSNFGEPTSIYKKFLSFSHSDQLCNKYDLSLEEIKNRKLELKDPLGRDVEFISTSVDVPKYVLDNIEKYSEHFIIA